MKKLLIILILIVGLIGFIELTSAQLTTIRVNVTYSATQNADNETNGVLFVANENIRLTNITKHPSSTSVDCIVISYDSNTTLTTGTFVGNSCAVNYLLVKGTTYRLGTNASVTRKITITNNTGGNPLFPIITLFGNFTGGYFGDQRNIAGVVSTVNSTVYNIQNITASNFSVNLISPTDNSFQINSTIGFLGNATGVGLLNATFYVWNSTGAVFNSTNFSLSGNSATLQRNISNFNLTTGTMKWNIFVCDSIGCAFANQNRSFTLGNFTEEFATTVLEGQPTGVNLSITFNNINPNLLALLTWNNTVSTPTKNIIDSDTIKFVSNFVIPVGTGNSSGVNITHFWRFYLPDGSLNATTNPQNQTVYSLGFDNCTSFSNLLFNYTLHDEDTISIINASATNSSIEIDLTATSLSDSSQVINFSRTYNVSNNARVCVSQIASGFRIDSQARYTANNYVVEFYNIQNSTLSASNFPQHIRLFPLLTSRSQEFLVTYKDENFLPIENALITVTRKYVGEGLFRTVEAPLTNVDGQALVHLVLSDVIYTIVVSKNGRILGTFSNIVPFCTNVATGDCNINLNSFLSGTQPENFNVRSNLSFAWLLNKTARTISNIFTTTDGSVALINLTSVVFDNRGNNTACSSTVQTSSGTLICNIPASIGNTTIRANLYKDGRFISQVIFNLNEADDTGFGATGFLMLLILYITIPLMMVSSGAGIVVGAILGMIFGAMLNLFDGGTIIGVTSTIIWFIIAGAIILYKINKERSG